MHICTALQGGEAEMIGKNERGLGVKAQRRVSLLYVKEGVLRKYYCIKACDTGHSIFSSSYSYEFICIVRTF